MIIDLDTLDGQVLEAVLECLPKCDHRMTSDPFWRGEAARKITDAVFDRLESMAVSDAWTEHFDVVSPEISQERIAELIEQAAPGVEELNKSLQKMYKPKRR